MIGGGGRLTAYGPVSLRMVLFGVAMVLTAIHLLQGKRMPREFVVMIALAGVMLLTSVVVGIAQGSHRAAWWEDVKPLLYLFALPFFYFSVTSEKEVATVFYCIRIATVFLAASFLALFILINTGLIPFLRFYHFVLPSSEFFFRGEISFVYKGFVFFGVGCLVWHMVYHRKIVAALLVVCIALTFTRGFMFALMLTYAAYYFWLFANTRLIRHLALAVAMVGIGAVVAVLGQEVISQLSKAIDYSSKTELATESNATSRIAIDSLDTKLLGDRQYSDSKRMVQIAQVLERITPSSVLWGHGFGQGIPERPVHMEISYLEIFHKQGIAGILFWLFVAVLLFRKFLAVRYHPLAAPLCLMTVFIFIQSTVNQYINNPIGISILLISLVGLSRLNDAQTPVNKTVTGIFAK